MIARVLLALATVVAFSAIARADSTVSRARAHFERGKTMYAAERYAEAITEFQAGYDLVPRPLFMLNLGHAYRKSGDLPAARSRYQQFIDAVPFDDPDRNSVIELCSKLDEQIAAANAPPPSPSERASPATATPVASASKPPPPRSFIRRHWWIIPVTAVALAGIGVGLYFGLRDTGGSCSNYSYGCVTVEK